MSEPALEQNRPIIDPHLHLWDIPAAPNSLQEPQQFLVQDAAALIKASGHNITHTVYLQAYAMYHKDASAEEQCLGETEFANGMAAMAASGRYGPSLIAHRIVGTANLCLGDRVKPILDNHLTRGSSRFRGIRMNTAYRASGLFGSPAETEAENRLSHPDFLEGARALLHLNLSLDVWCLHPQIPQVTALAKALPNLPIILNHIGTPDIQGLNADQSRDALQDWAKHIQGLAEQPNVTIKLSGIGMDVSSPLRVQTGTAHSPHLAQEWLNRFDIAVHAFSPSRCMFASNYPADRSVADYGVIWNAFKHLAAPYSESERDSLFHDTAWNVYRMEGQ